MVQFNCNQLDINTKGLYYEKQTISDCISLLMLIQCPHNKISNSTSLVTHVQVYRSHLLTVCLTIIANSHDKTKALDALITSNQPVPQYTGSNCLFFLQLRSEWF